MLHPSEPPVLDLMCSTIHLCSSRVLSVVVPCFVLDALGSISHSKANVNENDFIFVFVFAFFKAGIDKCKRGDFSGVGHLGH